MNYTLWIAGSIIVLFAVFAIYKIAQKKECVNCGSCRKDCKVLKQYLVYIKGMHCEHCQSTVKQAFKEAGFDAQVNLEKGVADIISAKELSKELAEKTVVESGFEFVGIEIIQ